MTALDFKGLIEHPYFIQHPITQKIVIILIIILAGFLLNLLVQNWLTFTLDKFRISTLPLKPIQTIIRWIVIFLVAAVIVNSITNVDLITLVTGALAMVAIGFVASWSVISHFFCAILLMILKPFDIGDTITIVGEGLSGRVVDLTLLYTSLRVDEHTIHQVPNSLFFQRCITRKREVKADVTLEEQFIKDEPQE